MKGLTSDEVQILELAAGKTPERRVDLSTLLSAMGVVHRLARRGVVTWELHVGGALELDVTPKGLLALRLHDAAQRLSA